MSLPSARGTAKSPYRTTFGHLKEKTSNLALTKSELVSELTGFLREMTTSEIRKPEDVPGGLNRAAIMREATQLSFFAQVVSFQGDVTDRLHNRRLQAAATLARTQTENLMRIGWMECHEDNALWFLAHSEDLSQIQGNASLRDIPTLRPETIALTNTGLEACKDRYDFYVSEIPPSSPVREADGRLKPLPTLAKMALAANLISLYRSYYAAGCNQTHTHPTVMGQYFSLDTRQAVIDPVYSDEDVESAWADSVGLLWTAIELRRSLGWAIDLVKLEHLRQFVTASIHSVVPS